MTTLLVALGSFFGFIVAYHTYGRWLATKIFNLDPEAEVPSKQLRDDVDFVPTKKSVIFGHHFTSIAGTGPIVGPAIAVFWGWLPALLWVVLGSIFIGAVHDFGALVVSMRNRGQTIGEVAGRLINPRARLLFLLILFFALTLVLAIFGLVIAVIFQNYPESVLSVWLAMPIAMAIGYWAFKKGGSLLGPSIAALFLLYGAIYVGVEYLPISFNGMTETVVESSIDVATGEALEPKEVESPTGWVQFQLGTMILPVSLPMVNPVVAWTMILMVYCFMASVLPVWLLLQPRDYVNSHQLFVALALLVGGLGVAGLTGTADLTASTPAIVEKSALPAHAPMIFPFLFITIACGACSGFHCLVSSGTSSKQVENEDDAQFVAYGSMLLEGALAVIVILACTAGVGMGHFTKNTDGTYAQTVDTAGAPIVGREAWVKKYDSTKGWSDFNLKSKVGAFVEGGSNFLSSIGIPLRFGIGIIATLVACFAATTLDSATRLQRYVIQELGGTLRLPPLQNKYGATGIAVALGLAVAMIPAGPGKPPGTGGLMLWPLFGATNQLLAGLAFMVTVFYLWRRSKPILFVLLPMIMMLLMPALALILQMKGWLAAEPEPKWMLFGFGALILGLQVWIVIEGFLLWPKVKGELENPLPPLTQTSPNAATSVPNC